MSFISRVQPLMLHAWMRRTKIHTRYLKRHSETQEQALKNLVGCAARKRREDFFSLSFDLNHNRFAGHLQFYPLPIVGDLTAEVFLSTSATAPCALF
jgi:hypothetical protein